MKNSALFLAFAGASLALSTASAAKKDAWGYPIDKKSSSDSAAAVLPADIPYTINVVADPGFEHGFEKDPRKGWVEMGTDGMEMKFVSASKNGKDIEPSEGKKALKIAVKKPGKYSNKHLNGSWSEFLQVKPVAGGVTTVIPVKGGAQYAFKFDWCSVGFFQQDTAPGPNRGLMKAGIYLTWLGDDLKGLKADKIETTEIQRLTGITTSSSKALSAGSPTWKTWAYPVIPAPEVLAKDPKKKPNFLKAPEAAKYVKVRFGLASQNDNAKPEFYVDNFIFAENPQLPTAPAATPSAPAKPAAK